MTSFRWLCAMLLAVMLCTGMARAQSSSQPLTFLRDTEIENTIREYATPIFVAAGLDPSAVRIYLLNDRQINAFVAGGQNLFLNSGLLLQSQDAGQVIGVIAHEVGHIEGGHLARVHDALSRGTAESIAAMVLGMAAAVVAGPEVGSAIMSGGSSVALRNMLQYSRTQEGAADAAAMRYLNATRQSAQGLLDFFGVLAEQEFLTPERQDPYLRSHPLTEDRIKALADFVARSPYSRTPTDPALQEKHRRMLAKLRAFLEDPALTRRRYPEADQSLEARYARAIAYHRAADLPSAIASIDGLIAEHPADPYFRELRGQILMERGRPADAIADYQTAVRLLPDAPLLRVDLARAQLATGDASLLEPAIQNLRAAAQREPTRPFIWRQLAIAYGRNGQEAESALALAEEAILLGKMPEARYHAGKAERLLPAGSPGWLQAQDILQAANQRERR